MFGKKQDEKLQNLKRRIEKRLEEIRRLHRESLEKGGMSLESERYDGGKVQLDFVLGEIEKELKDG